MCACNNNWNSNSTCGGCQNNGRCGCSRCGCNWNNGCGSNNNTRVRQAYRKGYNDGFRTGYEEGFCEGLRSVNNGVMPIYADPAGADNCGCRSCNN